MVERVRNRALTDKIVGDSFATMTRDELLKRLADADIAFAEVNTMADLAVHPHLRRIEVDTPNGHGELCRAGRDLRRRATALRRRARHRRAQRTAESSSRPDQIVMTEARRKLDLDHLRQWIGRSTEASDIVTAQLVKGLRATLFQEIGEPEAGRRRAVDRALVPGAAGVSDVGARPRRPPDPRRLPAAGAAAAPDVGRRRAGILRCLARRRRGDSGPRASPT